MYQMTFCFHSYSSIAHFSKFWMVETENELKTNPNKHIKYETHYI